MLHFQFAPFVSMISGFTLVPLKGWVDYLLIHEIRKTCVQLQTNFSKIASKPIFRTFRILLRITCDPYLGARFPGTASKYAIIDSGRTADRATVVTKDGTVYIVDGDMNLLLMKAHGGKNIKTFVSRRDTDVLALTEAGEVYSWESAAARATGDVLDLPMPLNRPPSVVAQIACGRNHFVTLTNYGEVFIWKDGPGGIDPMKPSEMTRFTEKSIAYVSCGAFHSAMVTENGEVFSWGDNDFGQLGIEVASPKEYPCKAMVPAAVAIKKVACGSNHTLALSDQGSVYVWGDNRHGQLGLSKDIPYSTPTEVKVAEMGKVVDIAATIYNEMSVAVDERGRIFIWGEILGGTILTPTLSPEDCVHKTFALFAAVPVMHRPLYLYDVEQKLADSLSEAFDDPDTSDLVIEVHGRPIFVHKAILRIRSAHFREILSKTGAQADDPSVIRHEGFPYEVYWSYLKYLYTDEIALPPKPLLELVDLASSYSEKQLRKRCVHLLKSNLTVENFVSMYRAAVEHVAEEIEEYCFNFALNHMTAIVQSPDFAELESPMAKAFIIKAAQAGAFRT